MSTFIKLLPLEMAEVDESEYCEPAMELESSDTIVGDMNEDHKKLWTLWKLAQLKGAQIKTKVLLGGGLTDDENSQVHKVEARAEVLRGLFWMAVHDDFDLWNESTIGVRKGYKIVTCLWQVTAISDR